MVHAARCQRSVQLLAAAGSLALSASSLATSSEMTAFSAPSPLSFRTTSPCALIAASISATSSAVGSAGAGGTTCSGALAVGETPAAMSAGSGLSSGKAMTSRMEGASARSMTRRSIPMPMPAVGGMPISRACRKSSSTPHASSSPAALSSAWRSKRSRWSTGSVSSEKALPSSRPTAKSSKRSVRPALLGSRCGFARGLTSTGYSQTKVGWISSASHSSSKQRLSSSPMDPTLAASGTPAAAAASCALAKSSGDSRSRLVRSRPFSLSLTKSDMVTRRHGGVRSTSSPP
mmetsp:Transcript_5474/g.15089  ORF Transcript_5474/g.15089 Transcript_5474/m.15089 type:complete len:290 (-) Transcript_5474:337-1206(-)